MLVQCVVDGFTTVSGTDTDAFAEEHCRGHIKESVSDLIDALSNMGITSRKDELEVTKDGNLAPVLTIVPYGGYDAQHHSLIELKTRSSRNPFPLDAKDIYAQAVWSSTPTTINALHCHGKFHKEQIYKLSELETLDATKELRKDVKRVAFLLKSVIKCLEAESTGSKFCLISRKAQPEMLYLKRGGRGAGLAARP